MTAVAFLGLGVMGGGMARQLVAAGFDVTVWNRGAARANPLRELGARVAPTAKDAALHADVVISMVADDEASRSVWLGPEGALAGIRPGGIAIDSSTVSPAWILELSSAAAARACGCLDAPVTGSRTHAGTGQLLFLVGGDAATLERARPVLAVMSREIMHIGPIGAGARLKLINNFLCGAQAAALAEAMLLIERSGLDRDAALTVLQNGAPGSPLLKAVSARMAARDYAVHFLLPLMHKDLRYASDEAHRQGLSLTTADTARALFERALADWSEADFSAVVEPLRRES